MCRRQALRLIFRCLSPSLARMFLRWNSTPLTETRISAAISPVVLPERTILATSSSVGVSPARCPESRVAKGETASWRLDSMSSRQVSWPGSRPVCFNRSIAGATSLLTVSRR